MDKKECLNLLSGYLKLESCVASLKNPDLQLKSHVFFYRDIYKEISELKIIRAISKNQADNIAFDIYYVSSEFEGLYHGFFRIKPVTETAEKIFRNLSKVCSDLGEYFYYVYQFSELLKIYLVSGNITAALEQCTEKNYDIDYEDFKKRTYSEIANYPAGELDSLILDRRLNEKYIQNFIKFNSKCSEAVKMFLISILSPGYSKVVCLLNKSLYFENHLVIGTNRVICNNRPEIPVYGLLDFMANNNLILFIIFDFDFEGGACIGKTVG